MTSTLKFAQNLNILIISTIFEPEMTEQPKKKKRLYKKLKHKYRLVVLNDESFQEELSFVLSPFNLIFFFIGLSVVIVMITAFVILYTPVKKYLPGSSYEEVAKSVDELLHQTDSLTAISEQQDLYIENLKRIMNGEVPISYGDTSIVEDKPEVKDIIPSKDDSMLRSKVVEAEKYNVPTNNFSGGSLAAMKFFPPLKGIVNATFDLKENHLGVDILAEENTPIKATLSGTVLFSGWTVETGHVIMIQHDNNLVSVYKHNSVILKKQGETVNAGDPIAIIGNTGELTTGPHLHFELWFESTAINPEKYILF